MMRFAFVVPLLLAPMLTPCVALAQMPVTQQPSAASEVSASGVAEIRVAPDHAVLATTVETRDRTAVAATKKNGAAARDIVRALVKLGLPEASVKTSDFSVDQYFPQRYDPREPPVQDGFVTRIVVRAETDNIEQVSAMIDAALDAGATRVTVQFSSSKMADARRVALESAFLAAKSDAAALALAAGGSLGRLLSVSPNGASPATMFRERVAGGSVNQLQAVVTTGAAYVTPGNILASVVVSARWELLSGPSH